jgi:photosystem II stability/assembly factor-like uncharacterized protein
MRNLFFIIFVLIIASGMTAQTPFPIHRQPPANGRIPDLNRPWQVLILDPNVSFFDVQKAFNAEWADKPYEKGKGYKQYKRWEYFMQQRVDKNGWYDAATAPKALDYAKKHLRPTAQRGPGNQDGQWTQLSPPRSVNGPGYSGNFDEGAGIITHFAFHPTDTNIIFASSPTGGVWRTKNAGERWELVSQAFNNQTILDLAINPAQPNIILAATQVGPYRSEDGGNTWRLINSMPLFFDIIAYNSINTKELWGISSAELLVSTDHGEHWEHRYFFPDYCHDMQFKPGTATTCYVATNTTIYRTNDGGFNFTTLNLWDTNSGRREMAVTPAAPDNLYVVTSSGSTHSGTYRSKDGGNSFQQIGEPNPGPMGNQCWHDLAIAVSNLDPNYVLVGGVTLLSTTDGGQTWNSAQMSPGSTQYLHSDIQTLDFHPTTHHLFVGCDGGIYQDHGKGTDYQKMNKGLGNTQVYRIGQSPVKSDQVIFGTQDNGTFMYKDRSFAFALGGDGMDCIFARDRPDRILASFQLGYLMKSDDGGKNFQYLASANQLTGIDGPWISPQVFQPDNSDVILAGFYDVWKTTDFGATWINTLPNTGYISDLEFARSNPQRVYAQSSSNVWISDDSGSNWQLRAVPNYLNTISVHPQNADKIVGVSYGTILKSDDGGQNWVNIRGSIPEINIGTAFYAGGPQDALYVGTDVGVFYRDNTLNDWVLFSDGLPACIVNDMEIDEISQKIKIGTYGLGLWESPLYAPAPPCPAGVSVQAGLDLFINCNQSPALLQANAPAGYAYAWTTEKGRILSGANTLNAVASTAGVYIFQAKNPTNGCVISDTIVVTSDFTPPDLHPTAGILNCQNDPVKLSAGYQAAGASFQWYGPNGFFSIQSDPSVTALGEYNLQVRGANGCLAQKTIFVKSSCTARYDVSLVGSISNPNPGLGGDVSVTFTLTNHGTEPATAIKIKNYMPTSGWNPNGIVPAYATQGSLQFPYQYWEVGDLAPGASAWVIYNIVTTEATAKSVYAEISESTSFDADSKPGNGLVPTPVEDDEAVVTFNASNPDPCKLVVNVGDVTCMNGNTPDNPDDDLYIFPLTVNTTGCPAGGQWIDSPGGNVLDLSPNPLLVYESVSRGDRTFFITPTASQTTYQQITIKAPPGCSDGIVVEQLPDLVVSDFSAPPALEPDQTGTYFGKIANNGPVAVTKNHTLGLWLSKDQFISADDQLLDTLVRSNMAAGTVEMIQGNFKIPATTLPGNYFLLLKADQNGKIVELGELNNLANFPIHIAGCAIQNSIANVKCHDNNTPDNEEDDTFTAEITLHASAECAASWTGGGQSGSYGQSATFGPFPIAQGNVPLTFTDISNANIITTVTLVPPKPCSMPIRADLVLDNLKIAPSGLPGTVVEYTFTLINSGVALAEGDYVIGAWLSLDKAADSTDTYVGFVNTGNTPVGTIPEVLGAIKIPLNMPTGDYYFVLKADKDNLVPELDEYNNETSAPFTVEELSSTTAPDPNQIFRIFPNPTTGLVTVFWGEMPDRTLRLAVYNSLGQCVLNQYPPSTDQKTQLDVSAWPAGHYWVRMEGEGVGWRKWLEVRR